MDEEFDKYSEGGYIGGGDVPIRIDPDECTINAFDVRAGRWVCSRAGHPTPTSDCTVGRHGMSRPTDAA